VTTSDDAYRPIACERYSELEVLAMRGATVDVELPGTGQRFRGRVRDLRTRAGVEYLVLETAEGVREELRLDRIGDVLAVGER
jgi:transcriptional antiterminator Rof (Rho-off)